jgi:hypothetical protein
MRALLIIISLFTQMAQAKNLKFKTLSDLDKCSAKYSENTGICLQPLKQYLQKNPKQILAAARKGRKVFASWAVLPFFDQVITLQKDKSICNDADFLISLFDATGQEKDGEAFTIAKKLIQNDCSLKIIERLQKEIESYGPASILVEIGCPVLKKAGKSTKNCELNPQKTEVKIEAEKLPKIEKSKIKISSAKVYSGPESSKVVIGAIEGNENLYLIHFSGFKGPWNNKSLLHKTSPSGNNGEIDYWTEYASNEWNSVITRSCISGYCSLEAFLPESGFKDGIGIYFNEDATKSVKIQEIINAFE